MTSGKETAHCFLCIHESKLSIFVQYHFRQCYGLNHPDVMSIEEQCAKFKDTG